MDVSAWPASADDLDVLVRLYRDMEAEQVALKAMWRLADGLPEPAEAALKDAIADPGTDVLLGGIDGVPLGFCVAGTAGLLPQADGEEVGEIRLIFTEPEARGVGIAAALLAEALDLLRGRGVSRFDVRVLPGHRHAKNFFEAAGFAARRITMHRNDDR